MFGAYKYDCVCLMCGSSFKGDRKDSKFCSLKCYYDFGRVNAYEKINDYEPAGGGGWCWKHRKVAEECLGRTLTTDEIVHHIDGNPRNNTASNLIVISRSDHAKLHNFLRCERVTLLKDSDENSENCWNNLIAQKTTAWLETANANVIRIFEIGQSAAETPTD